eukprot:1141061-Pelagomonas_calceolata.AAC.11
MVDSPPGERTALQERRHFERPPSLWSRSLLRTLSAILSSLLCSGVAELALQTYDRCLKVLHARPRARTGAGAAAADHCGKLSSLGMVRSPANKKMRHLPIICSHLALYDGVRVVLPLPDLGRPRQGAALTQGFEDSCKQHCEAGESMEIEMSTMACESPVDGMLSCPGLQIHQAAHQVDQSWDPRTYPLWH